MTRHHRRASRVSFLVLAGVAVVAVGIYVVKRGVAASGQIAQETSSSSPSAPGVASNLGDGQIAQPQPTVELVKNQKVASASFTAPTTIPANQVMLPARLPTTLPSGRSVTAVPPRAAPEGDAETIFKFATKLRDQGDLVAARDMINDALQANRFDGNDAQDAKTFIGALNEKIILSPIFRSADPFNDQWKVEPGTVLSKLAKRYNVTAALLCRVNGLSSPEKLKAGASIKAIKGPFHLVVSKSKFEADIYLGAPGGANAMYVKTVRVGLGSDGSTPTGTWKVGADKVVNPVYYSSRGDGVIAADDPKNPLGERWIPLIGVEGDCVGKESYGIHGTIDPDSIGKNMSQGCIRLASDDINLLYDLLIEGSLVKVVD